MRDSDVEIFDSEFHRAVVLPFKGRATQIGTTSRVRSLAQIFKAALIYVAVVFGTGFVLGTIRVLWLIPRFGERNAELLEQPLMLIAIILAARWIVRRIAAASRPIENLVIGLIALILLIVAELIVVLELRRLSISEYVESRDPLSGTVYLLMLGVFAKLSEFPRSTKERLI